LPRRALGRSFLRSARRARKPRRWRRPKISQRATCCNRVPRDRQREREGAARRQRNKRRRTWRGAVPRRRLAPRRSGFRASASDWAPAFACSRRNREVLASFEIVRRLVAKPEGDWAEYSNHLPITRRQVAFSPWSQSAATQTAESIARAAILPKTGLSQCGGIECPGGEGREVGVDWLVDVAGAEPVAVADMTARLWSWG
jgi:hypothetical protein